MYRDWFALQRRPFDKTPDPSVLYMSARHEEALARLEQACDDREIGVLAGEVGSGKTTLIRALLDRLDDSFVPVVLINPTLSPGQLVRQLASGLGLQEVPSRQADMLEAVYAAIFALHEQGKTPVLIVDEAHLLRRPEGFEQVRLLTNFQLDDENLMAVILVGQPELRTILDAPDMRAFRQRVGYFYFLPSIDTDDIRGYVDHRWQWAGGAPSALDPGIVEPLYTHSEGIPRRINQIMHNALLVAFGDESKMVMPEHIDRAAEELWL